MDASKSVITDSSFLTVNNNAVIGNCSVSYSGYFGNDLYNNLLYNKGDDERVYVRRRMAKGSNKFIMNDYKIAHVDEDNKLGSITSTFEIPDYAKTIGDEIYINLNLEKLFATTPIDTSKRKVSIENDYLYTINQVHILKIPAGYESSYIPKNTSVANELVDFSIKYNELNGEIYATQKIVLKKLYIQPEDFVKWNNTITAISPAYKEQVVLKKK